MTYAINLLIFLNFFTSQSTAVTIHTHSIDYWIGGLPPRCLINIIYFENTNDMAFNFSHDLPVLLTPIVYNLLSPVNKKYWKNHKFHNLFLRFMNPECYFSIIYYNRPRYTLEPAFHDASALQTWIVFIAFPYNVKYRSPSTFCLILYRKSEKKITLFYAPQLFRRYEFPTDLSNMVINVAVIFLSRSSRIISNVWCIWDYSSMYLTTQTITNEGTSVVTKSFIESCAYTFNMFGVRTHNMKFTSFDSKKFVAEHEVVSAILQKLNMSLATADGYFIFYDNPMITIKDNYLCTTFFPTFDNYIRIFTCYTVPVLSFNFYVSAFDNLVWILVILSGIAIAVFLKCHVFHNISKSLNFSTWLFYFSIFTEEAFSVPLKISKDKVYRTATILWLLTAVVLTNIYISHVISQLNAPLKGMGLTSLKVILDNFSTEYNLKTVFKFYDRRVILFNYEFKDFDVRPWMKNRVVEIYETQKLQNGFTFLSEPIRFSYPDDVWSRISNPYIYSVAVDNILQLFGCEEVSMEKSTYCSVLTNLMGRSNKYYPAAHSFQRQWNASEYARGAVEEELAQCKKSVYLEKSNQLEFKYMSDKYPKHKFYYLKKGYASKVSVWGFYHFEKSRVPQVFSLFLQSGIYHQRHKIHLHRDHLKRRSVTSEIHKRSKNEFVLDMTASIQTLFILFCGMILVATCALSLEYLYNVFPRLMGQIVSVTKNIVKCHHIYRFLKYLKSSPANTFVSP